jgi:hypothetical protein
MEENMSELDNMGFFDNHGPISAEEAYERFHKLEQLEYDRTIKVMGIEEMEEIERFVDDWTATHLQHLDHGITAVLLAASVGNLEDIINTVHSMFTAGAASYRERVLHYNPVLTDEIDNALHAEAELILRGRMEGKEHDSDETAA